MSVISAWWKIADRLSKIVEKKNADYGNAWMVSGSNGLIVRMADKMKRLLSLNEKEAEVDSESIIDTAMDMANYAIFLAISEESGMEQLKDLDVTPNEERLEEWLKNQNKYVILGL